PAIKRGTQHPWLRTSPSDVGALSSEALHDNKNSIHGSEWIISGFHSVGVEYLWLESNEPPAPFGGTEFNLIGIRARLVRSSERRWDEGLSRAINIAPPLG